MSRFTQLIIVIISILLCNCSKKNITQFQKSSVDNFVSISRKQSIEKKIKIKEFSNTLSIKNKLDCLLTINYNLDDTLKKTKRKKNPIIKPLIETGKNPNRYQKLSKTSGILGMSSVGVLLLTSLFSLPFFGEILIIGGLAAIVAIIFGIISFKKVKKKTMSKLGISLGLLYFIVVGAAILLLLWAILSIFNSIDIF